MTHEPHNLHGTGAVACKVYQLAAPVITYRYAYLPGTITLCARHADTERGLGPVSHGVHAGWCEVCHPLDSDAERAPAD